MNVNKLFQQNPHERKCMKINDVTITFVSPKNGLIGFASFVIEGGFLVNGVAIHERLGGDGFRLTYPTRKSGAVIFDICHPINRQVSKNIEAVIFQKLKNVMNESCNDAGHDCHQFTA